VKSDEIMINPVRRMVRLDGGLSACLVTGTEKVRCGYGNGDCMLLDFRRGVFAVADATERFSSSSSHMLHRLERMLSGGYLPSDTAGWSDCFSELYLQQEYRHKTTFSCVVLDGSLGGTISVRVISGGDSVVMITDSEGELLFRTSPDMNFAGRSRNAGTVHSVEINDQGSRILIFTDGLQDFMKQMPPRGSLSGMPAEFLQDPVDSIAEKVFEGIRDHENRYEHDDIALIALDPFRVTSSAHESIIIGGTTPTEESRFREMDLSADDRFVASGALKDFPGLKKAP
jgi:hypothetical protein